MLISTCLAYDDVQLEMSQLQAVYLLTIRDTKNYTVSFTLNYTQAKLLAEGIGNFIGQPSVQSLLDTQAGELLGGATFQYKISEDIQPEQKGEDETCQLPNLSARMATAS